jgi:negative regulator of flagellin synthesis FlgM
VKINNSTKSLVAGGARKETRPGKSSGNTNRGADTTSSSVQVSPLAAQLQQIESQLAGGEVVDPARVAEIKQAIADGRFRIDPNVIADRLLDAVKELTRCGMQ